MNLCVTRAWRCLYGWAGYLFFLWYSDCTAVKLKISYKISGPVFAFIKRIINESKWNIHHVPSVISLVIETVYFMKLSAIIRIVAVWNGQANWSKWKSIWSCIRLNFSFPKTDQTKNANEMCCNTYNVMNQIWAKRQENNNSTTTKNSLTTYFRHWRRPNVRACRYCIFFFIGRKSNFINYLCWPINDMCWSFLVFIVFVCILLTHVALLLCLPPFPHFTSTITNSDEIGSFFLRFTRCDAMK